VNENSGWLTLQLKSEEAFVSMEKELGVFMQAEKARSAKMHEQARLIKILATVAAVIFGIVVIGALVYLMRKNGLLTPHR
jgi:type IV secretory pathway component VirB8